MDGQIIKYIQSNVHLNMYYKKLIFLLKNKNLGNQFEQCFKIIETDTCYWHLVNKEMLQPQNGEIISVATVIPCKAIYMEYGKLTGGLHVDKSSFEFFFFLNVLKIKG